MKYVVWLLIPLLTVLHQDYWQWNNDTLLAGFLPFTLAYHGGISLAAAAVWALAIKFCWPEELDDVVAEGEETAAAKPGEPA